MEYRTTDLQPAKRYPTYQFHAVTAQKKLPPEQVFCICVLETLRWLRFRLKKFDQLPKEICTPEPEQFADFSMKALHSFSFSMGINVDVIYLENRGLWAFHISEPDAGANPGTKQARPAVNGRFFETEISFLLRKDCVEIGVRIICSEPSACTAPCEVFRPAVVRALAHNTNVGFLKNGFALNGKPMEIRNKSDFSHFEQLFQASDFDMPLILTADSGTVQKTLSLEDLQLPDVTKFSQISAALPLKNDLLQFSGRNIQMNEAESDFTKKMRAQPNRKIKRKTGIKEKSGTEAAKAETTEKRPVFPYDYLAEKLLAFGVVCFVSENCLEDFSRKYKLPLVAGDLLILRHGEIIEQYHYAQYEKNMQDFAHQRKFEVQQMLLRSAFSFGKVLFYSDAKIAALQDSQEENLSLEERCRYLQEQNAELKRQVQAFTQQNTDMRFNSERLRTTQKQLSAAEKERDDWKTRCTAMEDVYRMRESAYETSAHLVNFYREKADITAEFPLEKDDILPWAEKRFSENILFTQRARNSLRKCGGKPNCAILCDGLLYLDAYSRFRQGDLDEDTLTLYAERYCWNITFCGSEALRVYNHDYLAQADGKKYLLNMHLKYGVKVQELIRIYFCWDDALQKIILGYLPDHLPTLKDPT